MFLGAQPVLAATVQVGTCLPGVKSYSTIGKAVGSVTAASTVKVCPGTYTEQVNIFTPLTLEGVSSGNSDRAVIAAAGASLASNIDSIFGDPIVAQVLADAAGTVNISNITVDGSGNNQNNLVVVAGIFYASGTPGTVNGVTTLNQSGNGRGVGIWAENGNSRLESVTIENCDIHDVDFEGIFVGSNQRPPTLTATVKGNMIAVAPVDGVFYGIYDEAAGSITNNIIATGNISAGNAASNAVLSNTISVGAKGIGVSQFGATVKFNRIFNIFNSSNPAIALSSSSATVESNTIKDAFVGISFDCHTGNTVSGNTISDARYGITGVPSSQTVTNTYHNVDIIRTGGC
jgi:parallel beta-helix repeat protein